MTRLRTIATSLLLAALIGCDGGGDPACISPVPTPNACPSGNGEQTAGGGMDAGSYGGATGVDAAFGSFSDTGAAKGQDAAPWDPNSEPGSETDGDHADDGACAKDAAGGDASDGADDGADAGACGDADTSQGDATAWDAIEDDGGPVGTGADEEVAP